MPEYIERDEILHKLIEIGGCDATDEWDKGYDGAIDAAISIIDCAPAADVQPVKHGHWTPHGSLPANIWHCSECKGLVEVAHYCNKCYYDFCPACGSRMDGDE